MSTLNNICYYITAFIYDTIASAITFLAIKKSNMIVLVWFIPSLHILIFKLDVSLNKRKNNLGTSAIYIYIETSVSLILGYLFWIAMSKLGTPEIIGTSSAIISLAGIISVISNFGIPTGIQRFLGKSFAMSTISQTKLYFTSSLLLISISLCIILLINIFLSSYILSIFQINQDFFFISLVLIISTTYATLFRGIVISSLNTKILTGAITTSAVIKIILGVYFIMGGYGAFGLILSFTINQLLVSIILGIHVLLVFRKSKDMSVVQDSLEENKGLSLKYLKDIFSSSIVYWVPQVITTVGSQMSTIFVYGVNGSEDAGLFFMALTIVIGITSVMYSLFTISLPAISAMDDYRKRFTTNTIRLSLLIAIPFSSSLIFYSDDILGLLGSEYVKASAILDILLLSMMPTAVQYGVTSLVYSYGKYRQVLFLGLSTSIPRVALYIFMIPIFGNEGGAWGYTIGSIIGYISSIIIAKQNNLRMEWRKTLLIFTIPMVISFILERLDVYYIYGILLNLIFSYVSLYAFKVVLIKDLQYVNKLIPSSTLGSVINKIVKKNKDEL